MVECYNKLGGVVFYKHLRLTPGHITLSEEDFEMLMKINHFKDNIKRKRKKQKRRKPLNKQP